VYVSQMRSERSIETGLTIDHTLDLERVRGNRTERKVSARKVARDSRLVFFLSSYLYTTRRRTRG
jgi:hypothetical protein